MLKALINDPAAQEALSAAAAQSIIDKACSVLFGDAAALQKRAAVTLEAEHDVMFVPARTAAAHAQAATGGATGAGAGATHEQHGAVEQDEEWFTDDVPSSKGAGLGFAVQSAAAVPVADGGIAPPAFVSAGVAQRAADSEGGSEQAPVFVQPPKRARDLVQHTSNQADTGPAPNAADAAVPGDASNGAVPQRTQPADVSGVRSKRRVDAAISARPAETASTQQSSAIDTSAAAPSSAHVLKRSKSASKNGERPAKRAAGGRGQRILPHQLERNGSLQPAHSCTAAPVVCSASDALAAKAAEDVFVKFARFTWKTDGEERGWKDDHEYRKWFLERTSAQSLHDGADSKA